MSEGAGAAASGPERSGGKTSSGAPLWLLVSLLLVAGCGSAAPARPAPAAARPAPFADCAGLAEPPPAAPPAPSGSTAGGAPAAPMPLPAVELPCYTGDSTVQVAALRGPAIVNLWASWCGPCRHELPVLQRYADRAGGQVHVLGVVTEDTRSAAESLAQDLLLRFPTLYDRSAQLRRLLNRTALPVTLFVDRLGQIRAVYNAKPLDEATLSRLAAQHLGVVVG